METGRNLPTSSLFQQAYECLLINNPIEKVARTQQLRQQWLTAELTLTPTEKISALPVPGRPDKPELVHPRKVPRRNFNTTAGRLSLVHAIAHIEFNAINLALDAVYRFQTMPEDYYHDWCLVAEEEARHFTLVADYLADNGVHYGDLAAHNGLWEMALKTDFDVLVRMALVPRVLEARGLDVTPGMIKKLQAQSQTKLVKLLTIIFNDEIGHVKTGTKWFNYLCQQRDLDAESTFSHLLDKYMQNASFGPFDMQARYQAGFTRQEMENLIQRSHLHKTI